MEVLNNGMYICHGMEAKHNQNFVPENNCSIIYSGRYMCLMFWSPPLASGQNFQPFSQITYRIINLISKIIIIESKKLT